MEGHMKKYVSFIILIVGLLLVSCSSSVESYQIKYHTDTTTEGTSAIETKTYLANQVIQEDEFIVSLDGFVFKGWCLDKNRTTPVSYPYTVKESTDFYAKWAKLYTVLFMIEDQKYQSVSVEENTILPKIKDPVQEGSTFTGWFLKLEDSTPFDITQPITADVTLHAKFKENGKTVTFYDDTTIVKTETVQPGNTVILPEHMTKEGHTFKGWSTSKTEFILFDETTPITEDIQLYAFYEINKYKVEFIIDQTTYTTQTVKYNTFVSVITPPIQEGQTFVGWFTEANEPFDYATPIKEHRKLYAKYESTTLCTVTFQVDHQSRTEQVNKHQLVVKPTDPVKTGYTFIGWYYGIVPFDFNSPITEDITLTAKFEIASYEVKFYNGETLLQSDHVDYNGLVVLPEAPDKLGYTFKGWSLDSHQFIAFDETKGIKENTTLYAYFEIQTFQVIFRGNGKVLDTQTIEYGKLATSILPPVQIGFTFEGWFANESYTIGFDFTTPIQKETTIYGKFTPVITYTVTFETETEITTETVNKNGNVNEPSTPTKQGYTFVGWFVENKQFDFTTPITEDITLVAKFEIKVFEIKFYNAAVLYDTQNIAYGNTVVLPAEPNKVGHTFKGWSTSSTSYVPFSESTPIEEDKTLYAFFEANTYTVTFIANEQTIDTLSVAYGNSVQAVKAPEQTGFAFIGWFLPDATTAFDFTAPITQNIVLTAKYEEVVIYTITFQVEDETFTQQVNASSYAKEPEQPIKDGYAFLGWFYDDTKFNFNTPIEDDILLVARFEKESFTVTSSGAYQEGLFVEFNSLTNTALADYSVEYKPSTSTTYQTLDRELIREKNGIIRFDIIGLSAGEYDVRLSANDLTMTRSFSVVADDRSGYAHFGYTKGIGAYNDDGTLKDNAVVVYVTDETKNTVTAKIGSKTYTGLVNIIQASTNASYALDIRILGEIQTTQWNSKTHGKGNTADRQNNLENTFKYTSDSSGWDTGSSSNYTKLNEKEIISKGINSMSDDIAKGITQLKGLTNQVLRDKKASSAGNYEYDSYYNMLDVSGGQNITIEGIGTDATIFQWGFAFKKCNSIEVKNLRFYNYTEDAVGFEGTSGKQKDFGNYWVHNCTFDLGVNNWDVCYENDKTDGDGSTDVKYCHSVTISYTQYNKTHKTNLIGSSDSALQYNITLHHNYYNQCGSRLPLVRQANIHMYNNYYYGSTGYSSSIRANCYAFVENCYYDGGKNPYEIVTSSTHSKTGAKYYNNLFNNVSSSGSYKKENTVTSRTASVSSGCMPDGSTDYSNFDTNATLFYYDSVNKVSKVKDLLDPTKVPEHCKTYSGVLKSNVKFEPSTPEQPDVPENPDEGEITWTNVLTEDFSSTQTITQISAGDTAPKGISYYYTGGTDGSVANNNLTIEDGSLKIIDTSTATTFGYYMFDQTYTTGKVKVAIDFTPTTSNGKWTPIHFLDGNSNIGIRTNDSKILGYTTDSSTVTPILNSAITANKTYHIELILDFDKNTASISIDGNTVVLTNYSCHELKGIMFQTAGTNSRSFSVDNITIDTAN